MTLDPKKKIKLIEQICARLDLDSGYINAKGNRVHDFNKVKIFLDEFNINRANNYFDEDILYDASDDSIVGLSECLLSDDGLKHLFHDKYAMEVLVTEDKFFNLNLYLNECFECVKADRKIATAMLLRCCVEILVNLSGYKERTLAASIDKFIKFIDSDKTFIMFSNNNKQNELKQFLEGIKNFANDAAHLNGKNVKDFIDKYDNEQILKLFCILVEHSILKDDIKRKNEEDIENRVKSIDLTIREKVIANSNIKENVISDESLDDIPF